MLDARVGDGTYVTSLDSELLLTGMGFVGDLLAGPTLWRFTRSGESSSPSPRSRGHSAHGAGLRGSERCLDLMDGAETTQAFIDADAEFHRIIVQAAGNATLATLIQNLSSGMLRARMWRTIAEEGAVEITRQRHRDIYLALRAADAERASAADALHLAEGEDWLRRVIATGDTLALTAVTRLDRRRQRPRSVKAVFYEGLGRFALRDSSLARPPTARCGSRSRTAGSAEPTCTSRTAQWTIVSAHRR